MTGPTTSVSSLTLSVLRDGNISTTTSPSSRRHYLCILYTNNLSLFTTPTPFVFSNPLGLCHNGEIKLVSPFHSVLLPRLSQHPRLRPSVNPLHVRSVSLVVHVSGTSTSSSFLRPHRCLREPLATVLKPVRRRTLVLGDPSNLSLHRIILNQNFPSKTDGPPTLHYYPQRFPSPVCPGMCHPNLDSKNSR